MKIRMLPNRFIMGMLLLLGFAFVSTNLFAADEAGSITTRIEKLEAKLKEIDQTQRSILQKQDEILEKLDVLKIWVRRS